MLSLTLILLYYLVQLAKSRGKRSWRARQITFTIASITPQATFYTREEITAWGDALGLSLANYDPSPGNVHVFAFRKPSHESP